VFGQGDPDPVPLTPSEEKMGVEPTPIFSSDFGNSSDPAGLGLGGARAARGYATVGAVYRVL